MDHLNLSQHDFAGRINSSPANVSKLLGNSKSSTKRISYDILRLSADALAVTQWYLLGVVDGKHNCPPLQFSFFNTKEDQSNNPGEETSHTGTEDMICPAFFEQPEIFDNKIKLINSGINDPELFNIFMQCQELSISKRNIIKVLMKQLFEYLIAEK